MFVLWLRAVDLVSLDRKLERAWAQTPKDASHKPAEKRENGAKPVLEPKRSYEPADAWRERFARIIERRQAVFQHRVWLHDCDVDARWRILGYVLLGRPDA